MWNRIIVQRWYQWFLDGESIDKTLALANPRSKWAILTTLLDNCQLAVVYPLITIKHFLPKNYDYKFIKSSRKYHNMVCPYCKIIWMGTIQTPTVFTGFKFLDFNLISKLKRNLFSHMHIILNDE